MKPIIPLTAALLLTGCPTLDEMRRVGDLAATTGQVGRYVMSEPYNTSAYGDGYQQGYRAGYNDAESGRSYRPRTNYDGTAYSSAFSDGYYKGYEVGYYDSRDRRGFNLRR
jgi:hypothetical protein